MKPFRIPMLVLSAIILIVPAIARAEDPVSFPDPGLEAAVRQALGIPSDPIMPADMLNLTNLQAVDKGIADLRGLEHASNFVLLDLQRNLIADVSPLASLANLQFLYLEGNQIVDVSPLGGLVNLRELGLDDSPIADISPLSALANLRILRLAGTQTSNIEPLANLVRLRALRLGNNQIVDISPLVRLTALNRLNLDLNRINDITPLAGMTNLGLLYMMDNEIADISALSKMTALTDLQAWDNQISDISPLAGLSNLRTLRLENNQITDVGPLSGLNALTYLALQQNQITDVSPLGGLTNLTDLRVWSNPLVDVSCLSNLTNLTQLHLGRTPISDISALGNLTKLTYLGINVSLVADISVVQNMTVLQELRAYDSQVSDMSPLTALTTLKRLNVTGCPLSWQSYCLWLPAIQANNPGLTNLQVDPNPYTCLPEPTPEGSGVGVTPTDSATGTTPVTMTFDQVTTAGATILMTSGTGPTPPAGFQLGDPATFYEITTSASFTGLIDVCVSYVGVSYQGPPEALRLMHYENGQWVDCTTTVNTETQTVCGAVTSLSPFAIMTPPLVFQSLAVTPNVLWPPNHKMVPIAVTWTVTDSLDLDFTVALKSITMNEGDETNTYDPAVDTTIGDGHTTNDMQVNADDSIWLRAERSGTNAGRTYTLTYEATDSMGNTATKTVIVTVPHNAP